jgi:hypothetical protein
MSFKANDLMLQVVPQQAPGFHPALLAEPIDPLFKQYAATRCGLCTNCSQCTCTQCSCSACSCSNGCSLCTNCSVCSCTCTNCTNFTLYQAAGDGVEGNDIAGGAVLLLGGEGLETLQQQMSLELTRGSHQREVLVFAN